MAPLSRTSLWLASTVLAIELGTLAATVQQRLALCGSNSTLHVVHSTSVACDSTLASLGLNQIRLQEMPGIVLAFAT